MERKSELESEERQEVRGVRIRTSSRPSIARAPMAQHEASRSCGQRTIQYLDALGGIEKRRWLLEWEAEKKRAYLGEDGVIVEGGSAR
jgi:hypothetical protein